MRILAVLLVAVLVSPVAFAQTEPYSPPLVEGVVLASGGAEVGVDSVEGLQCESARGGLPVCSVLEVRLRVSEATISNTLLTHWRAQATAADSTGPGPDLTVRFLPPGAEAPREVRLLGPTPIGYHMSAAQAHEDSAPVETFRVHYRAVDWGAASAHQEEQEEVPEAEPEAPAVPHEAMPFPTATDILSKVEVEGCPVARHMTGEAAFRCVDVLAYGDHERNISLTVPVAGEAVFLITPASSLSVGGCLKVADEAAHVRPVCGASDAPGTPLRLSLATPAPGEFRLMLVRVEGSGTYQVDMRAPS